MAKKVLALDYGKKRIGFASGDLENRVAIPKGIFENKGIKHVIPEIESFCDEWEIGLIIVGLPLNMDKEELENEMVQEVRYFVGKLREVFEIDIELFDERLSSYEADGLIKASGGSSRDNKMHRDAYAAQVILQRYFDSVNL